MPLICRSLSFSLFAVSLTLTASTALGREEGSRYAPNQAIVEFVPGAISVPPNPGTKVVPIGEVSGGSSTAREGLVNLGATHLELLAIPWRWIERWTEHDLPDDHVPPLLKSFRDIYLVHFAGEQQVESLLEGLRQLPDVSWAGGNVLLDLPYWPDDPYLPCPTSPCDDTDPGYGNYQWNMENAGGAINGIDCDGVTDVGLRGAYVIQSECTVKIGHMDSGVQKYESGSPPTYHEDLEENLDYVLGRNFTGSPADSMDWGEDSGHNGHGTAVAGILGAVHNEIGVAGICGKFPENEPVIVPLRIWTGSSSPEAARIGDGRRTGLQRDECRGRPDGIDRGHAK